MQAGQTLYMLDYAGPPGFAQAAARTGARWALLCFVGLDDHTSSLAHESPTL